MKSLGAGLVITPLNTFFFNDFTSLYTSVTHASVVLNYKLIIMWKYYFVFPEFDGLRYQCVTYQFP